MKLLHIKQGPLQVNTYFLVNEQLNSAIVIDSGENYKKVKQVSIDNGFEIKYILLTHAHFDHAGNVKRFQDDGVKIYISKIDAPKLLNEDNLSLKFGRKFDYCKADYEFSDDEVLRLLDIDVKVILTPGHTDGSATFKVDNLLFTGDTLFFECVGRTDFISGNKSELINSVNKLYGLHGNFQVLPGHREFTTLEHERLFNYFKDYD